VSSPVWQPLTLRLDTGVEADAYPVERIDGLPAVLALYLLAQLRLVGDAVALLRGLDLDDDEEPPGLGRVHVGELARHARRHRDESKRGEDDALLPARIAPADLEPARKAEEILDRLLVDVHGRPVPGRAFRDRQHQARRALDRRLRASPGVALRDHH